MLMAHTCCWRTHATSAPGLDVPLRSRCANKVARARVSFNSRLCIRCCRYDDDEALAKKTIKLNDAGLRANASQRRKTVALALPSGGFPVSVEAACWGRPSTCGHH